MTIASSANRSRLRPENLVSLRQGELARPQVVRTNISSADSIEDFECPRDFQNTSCPFGANRMSRCPAVLTKYFKRCVDLPVFRSRLVAAWQCQSCFSLFRCCFHIPCGEHPPRYARTTHLDFRVKYRLGQQFKDIFQQDCHNILSSASPAGLKLAASICSHHASLMS